MNQDRKEHVYAQGTKEMVQFLADFTEMSPKEKTMLEMYHERETDETVLNSLRCGKTTYSTTEDGMTKKLLWGILYCINFTMENIGQ